MNAEIKPNMENNKVRISLVSLQSDAERVQPVGLVYIATYLHDKLKLSKRNIRIFDFNYFDVEGEIKNLILILLELPQ